MSQGLRRTSIALAILGLVVFVLSMGYLLVGLTDNGEGWTCTSNQSEPQRIVQSCEDAHTRLFKSDSERLSLLGIGLELAAVALAAAGHRGGLSTSGPMSSAFGGPVGANPPIAYGSPAMPPPVSPPGTPTPQYPAPPIPWQQQPNG